MILSRPAYVPVLLAALALTIANAFKPLVADDAGLYPYAEQISQHPTDPYGFEMLWWETPQPANHVLTPPGLVYWWGGGIALFGDRPVLWKLWLFPLALLLCSSLWCLLERVVPRREAPILWLIVLSPAVLPSLNLMLDLHALALGLSALVVFMSACERGRWPPALLAGLVAGVAMQTKYSAVLYLVALLVYGVVMHRPGLSFIAGAMASAVFIGWEAFVAARYGESHFLYALEAGPIRWTNEGNGLSWSIGLSALLGATAPGIGLIGLAALRVSNRVLILATLCATGVFALLPFLPADRVAKLVSSIPNLVDPRPELAPLGALGGCVIAISAVVVFRRGRMLWRRWRKTGFAPPANGSTRTSEDLLDLFLLAWLAIQLVGFFLVPPFMAVRRIIGLTVVLTLVMARALVSSPRPRTHPRLLQGIVAWSILLGILFYVSDLGDALARRRAVAQTETKLAELGAGRGGETIWYIGHWGFQFYADRAGMQPVLFGRSTLEAGDWLVIPVGVDTPTFRAAPTTLRRIADLQTSNAWPWSTLPAYYSGPIAIRSQPSAQLVVHIYRVRSNLVLRMGSD